MRFVLNQFAFFHQIAFVYVFTAFEDADARNERAGKKHTHVAQIWIHTNKMDNTYTKNTFVISLIYYVPIAK